MNSRFAWPDLLSLHAEQRRRGSPGVAQMCRSRLGLPLLPIGVCAFWKAGALKNKIWFQVGCKINRQELHVNVNIIIYIYTRTDIYLDPATMVFP